ncbi:MAG: DUF4157 domain-containing protein, partial [Acidobacteriota bacterium]
MALQRHTADHAEPATVPPIVHNVLRSPGQPLDAGTRAFFEPRFGHDFSKVRVHTDAKAAESALAVNALAYTAGQDVVFAPGLYSVSTNQGRSLLAHELAHVVQQSDSGANSPRWLSRSDEPSEREASRAAALSMENRPVGRFSASPPVLQRQPPHSPAAPTGAASHLRPCDPSTQLPKILGAMGLARRLVNNAVKGIQNLVNIWGKAPQTDEENATSLALAKGFNIAFDKTLWVPMGTSPAVVSAQDK